MKLKMIVGLFILILIVAACSTAEESVFDTASIAEDARADAAEAIEATQIALANQPTAVPVEETEAVSDEAETTEEVSDEAEATEETSEEVADTETEESSEEDATDEEVSETEEVETTDANSLESDPLFEAVASADVANGEMLFNFMAAPPCSSCHTTTEDTLVGPGQYNLLARTIEGIENGAIVADGPYSYIYESIINPNDFAPEGFAVGLMPDLYEGMLAEQDVYDLVAYLASLGD